MYTRPLTAALLFTVSHTFLDDLDGIAARRLKQGEEKMEFTKSLVEIGD